ncbi:hypothetical protein FPOAC2_01043 [Fusarium poae]
MWTGLDKTLDQHAMNFHHHTLPNPWQALFRIFPKDYVCGPFHESDRLHLSVGSPLEALAASVGLASTYDSRIFPSESLMQPFMRPNSYHSPQVC